MSVEKIEIEALIKASSDKVYQLWTDPDHITKWNFASDDWCCPRAENELRVGGKYKSRMEAKDGSFGFDFEGEYEEVNPSEKLVYSMPDGRKVQTTFEEEAGSTRVTTQFDPEAQNSIDMQREGWQAILDNFKKYAETR
ncbi:SRPBCC family protein [Litorimonas haliclonae]|uniref:SRPBCC family protein n=1 Tax=Litorimonas haliclonae TaxID=2081977 RepID=UPI0039EE9BF3